MEIPYFGVRQYKLFLFPSWKKRRKLYFRQQIPASRERDPQSILIIGVNDTEFMRLLDMALPNDDGTSIFVLTEEEQLYLSRMKESALLIRNCRIF